MQKQKHNMCLVGLNSNDVVLIRHALNKNSYEDINMSITEMVKSSRGNVHPWYNEVYTQADSDELDDLRRKFDRYFSQNAEGSFGFTEREIVLIHHALNSDSIKDSPQLFGIQNKIETLFETVVKE